MNKFYIGILLAVLLLVSGCKTLTPEPDTPLPMTIPKTFSSKETEADQKTEIEHTRNWWQIFNSSELNGFIDKAWVNNFDLKTLRTRMDQANAKLEKEKASYFPDLNFSFTGQKKGIQIKPTQDSSTSYENTHSWDGSLTSSYSPDVWGKVNASEQAQNQSLLAIERDLAAMVQEVTAQIVVTWVDIIAARKKIEILKDQIKINQNLLDYQKLRFSNGRASALDVSQQQKAMAEARSQIPLLEKQASLLLNNLAFISGGNTAESIIVATTRLPEPQPLPDLGIPSDLLDNRSDIQAAKMRLSSAQWEIQAAKADLLPSINLTARALFSSGKLDLLFQNWVASLAASIAGPVFDGGFRKAELKRARAAAQEQLNLYAKTVASAIREVEDHLVRIEKQDQYIKLLDEELSITRQTLKDAMVQYQNGQSSYLSYLTAWTSIEKLERQLVGENAMGIKERIGLYKALGWQIEK